MYHRDEKNFAMKQQWTYEGGVRPFVQCGKMFNGSTSQYINIHISFNRSISNGPHMVIW